MPGHREQITTFHQTGSRALSSLPKPHVYWTRQGVEYHIKPVHLELVSYHLSMRRKMTCIPYGSIISDALHFRDGHSNDTFARETGCTFEGLMHLMEHQYSTSNRIWRALIVSMNEQTCFLQTSPHLYCMQRITDESTEPHFLRGIL